jgi:hypothetical protein
MGVYYKEPFLPNEIERLIYFIQSKYATTTENLEKVEILSSTK